MKNVRCNYKKIITLLTASIVLTTGCSNKSNLQGKNEIENSTTIENDEINDETRANLDEETTTEKENNVESSNEVTTEEVTTTIGELPTEPEEISSIENSEQESESQELLEIYEPNKNLGNEEEVISFLENVSDMSDDWISSDKLETVKENVTTGVATFILFMSGDSTIGGYTFSSLTDAGKQKVEILFMKMDNKLESKFPGYKEKIGEKWTIVKNFTTQKFEVIKNNVKNYIIDKVGEENYNEALNNFSAGFNDMKNSFSNTFEFIGDKAGDAKDKMVDWAKEKIKTKEK